MAQLDLNTTHAESLGIIDYSTTSQALETSNAAGDKTVTFPNAAVNIGFYKSNPELKKAIDKLGIFTVGQGINTDPLTQAKMDLIQGWGEDSIHSILWNMQVMKKVIGDSFAEIVRYEDTDKIVNIKPISAERIQIIVGKNGLIKYYEQINLIDKSARRIDKKNMFHLCNDRVGDETHGTSCIDACKWIINAIEEVRRDHKVVMHRNKVPLRILEIDEDNYSKRDKLLAEYKKVATTEDGMVLAVPKGTIAVTTDQITIQDPIAWIAYLENLLYQAVGVPRVIATSEGLSEAGGKVSYFTFEPVYTWEQILLEADIKNQLGWKIVFNRPPSLKDNVQSNEAKNAGQVGIQPNDTKTGMTTENG